MNRARTVNGRHEPVPDDAGWLWPRARLAATAASNARSLAHIESRAMPRRARVVMACLAWVSLAPCSAPAFAARPRAFAARSRTVPTGRAAAKLARIIRRDALLQGRRSRRGVTVTKRCCGVRVLRVHYYARLAGDARDAYVLRVETRAGLLEGVALVEHASEERSEPGGKVLKRTSDDVFAIKLERSGGGRAPSLIASSVEAASRTGGSGPQSAVSSFSECRSSAPLPRSLFERVLTSLARAKRHYPAVFADLPRFACEAPARGGVARLHNPDRGLHL
jgi:hypothetical protein